MPNIKGRSRNTVDNGIVLLLVTISVLWIAPAGRAEESPATSIPSFDRVLPPAPPLAPFRLSDQELIDVQRQIKGLFAELGAHDGAEATPEAVLHRVAALNGGPLTDRQAAELEVFRSRASLILAVARIAPSLAGDVDRSRLPAVHRHVLEATAEELYVLRQRLEPSVGWPAADRAIAEMDPRLLDAWHGGAPLGAAERHRLESLRDELEAVLARIEGLSPAARRALGVRAAGALRQRLDALPTEGLMPMHRQIDRAALADARRVVAALERLERRTPADRDHFERFRTRLLQAIDASDRDAEVTVHLRQRFAAMSYDGLAVAELSLPELADGRPPAKLDPITLDRLAQMNVSCGILEIDPCQTVSNTVNSVIVNPINAIIGAIEDGINLGVEAVNEITDLFDGLDFSALISSLLDAALAVVTEAMADIGDAIVTIDQVLGQAVLAVREFADDVKRPFIDLVNSAGDPLAQSQLLTQLDAFMFNRNPDDGPLGLVTCMEEVLCVETEIVEFEVVLPDGTTEIMQEQLCRRGLFIPLIGAVGSDRSVFACMVIKNEIAFFKDLLPEDSLPGGKVADIALSAFVHKLDQLCFVNDWMAGNRRLLLNRVAKAERDARFERILGSCTLDGTDLICPDLPAGASIASVLAEQSQALTDLGVGVTAVQGQIDGLSVQVADGFLRIQTSIGVELEAFQALDLQLRMESNLGMVDQELVEAVSLFMLPESVGGMIELVRDLVGSVIERAEAAGLSTGRARTLLEDAIDNLGLERYRTAYSLLANAYGEVVAGNGIGD